MIRGLTFKLTERSIAERVGRHYATADVLRREDWANFFGIQSRGARQIRGNGPLLLTQGALHFFLLMPKQEVRIDLADIMRTDIVSSFLDRTVVPRPDRRASAAAHRIRDRTGGGLSGVVGRGPARVATRDRRTSQAVEPARSARWRVWPPRGTQVGRSPRRGDLARVRRPVRSCHQTLKKWLRVQPVATSLATLQRQLNRFRSYYNTVRPHRALGRRTPAQAYAARPKAVPTGPVIGVHYRVRHDTIDNHGSVTLRHDSRLHHIGLGARLRGTPILLLIDNLHIRITHRHTGQLIRELTLDPTRDYARR